MTGEREPQAESAIEAKSGSFDSASAHDLGSEPDGGHAAASFNSASFNTVSADPKLVDPKLSSDRWSAPGRLASQIFGYLTAVGVVIGVLAVIWLAATNHPHRAAVLLGSGSILLGAMRGLWPGKPWFASRHRLGDCLAFVCIGIAILWLSPWTSTISPF